MFAESSENSTSDRTNQTSPNTFKTCNETTGTQSPLSHDDLVQTEQNVVATVIADEKSDSSQNRSTEQTENTQKKVSRNII